MVWKETCALEERLRFVLAVASGEETFAALCRRFGVSRRVGYKWYARYRLEGVSGLSDRSRARLGGVRTLCLTRSRLRAWRFGVRIRAGVL